MNKKDTLFLITACLLTLVIFFKALSNFFFMDDFVNMYIGWVQNWDDLRTMLFSFQTYPYTAYRPIPYFLYGYIIINIFHLNPIITHLAMFSLHIFNAYLVYKLSKSIITALIYSTAAIHFGSLYWWSGHYVTVGTTFFLLSILTYPKWKTLLLYVPMLLSNESLLLIPIIYLFISKLQKKHPPYKLLSLMIIMSLASFIFRLRISKFGQLPDYAIGNITQIIQTIRWYFLRLTNLPEAVQSMPTAERNVLYTIVAMFIITLVILVFKFWKKIIKNSSIHLGSIIFITTASAFFLLPKHLSSYYLNTGFVGAGLILGTIISFGFSSQKFQLKAISLISIITFLTGSFISVQYMSKTSPLVWRGEIARNYIEKVRSAHPVILKNATIIFQNTKVPLGELSITLYHDKALRLYYNDKTIKVLYGKKSKDKNLFVIQD